MIRLQMVVPVLLGLTLGTAAHAAVPTTVPSPTLSQVAKCDSAALTLNLVNGKPMTLNQARRIQIGSAFTVPVDRTHVTRVMSSGDNPWVLCREELALQAQRVQTATATMTVSEPPSPASTAKPVVRLETSRGNVSDAATASLLHFDTAPLVAVTQEKLPPAMTPTMVGNAGQTYFVSATPSTEDWWMHWLTPEMTLLLVRLALLYLLAMVLICLTIFCARTCHAFWKELRTREKSALPPQAGDTPVPVALEERAPIPQGTVDIGFVLRVPGESDVPFKASGEVSRSPRTIIVGGKQQQCFAIDGCGPWYAYLPTPKTVKNVCIATFNNGSGTLDVECAGLNREVRAAISSETTEPTKLDTAIRAWLESRGVNWKKMGSDAENVRGPIIFPAKA